MSWLQAIARVRQSFIEQRRSIQENVYFQVWIGFGDRSAQRECTVFRVRTQEFRTEPPRTQAKPLPQVLSVPTNANFNSSTRRCMSSWRTGGTGRFVGTTAKRAKRTRVIASDLSH
jgi:hypothetical protein